MDFQGTATPLDDADITAEAQRLGCEPAAIWAVCEVESAGSGFLPDKRPKILFEAKAFHTYSGGKYDNTHPNISSASWNQALYGAAGTHQYDRLAEAIKLDRTAALKSASWGRFQVMGFNSAMCGWADVEQFVQAMMDDEANHLTAFGNYCKKAGIDDDLVNHDWSHFALGYNGSGQVTYYAQKLAAAYQRNLGKNSTSAPSSPAAPSSGSQTVQQGNSGSEVLLVQQKLVNLGYNITADGNFGPMTKSAVQDFQQKHGLTADGVVGPRTLTALASA